MVFLRWIAIVLLMLNVGYFVVAQTVKQPVQGVIPSNTQSDNTPQLVLLREKNGAKAQTEQSISNNDESVELDVPTEAIVHVEPVDFCWEVGGFTSEAEAILLKKPLEQLQGVYEWSVKHKVVAGEPDYWVFLGPYDSRRQALVVHRDMQSRKIDSFLIADGELTNAVSLGLFSKESGAKTMQEARKKQGLDAKVKAVPRMRNEWWITVRANQKHEADEIKRRAIETTKKTLQEIVVKSCEVIANNKKLD